MWTITKFPTIPKQSHRCGRIKPVKTLLQIDLAEWFVLEALFSNASFSNEFTVCKLKPLMDRVLSLTFLIV